jgi:hypothetical protein
MARVNSAADDQDGTFQLARPLCSRRRAYESTFGAVPGVTSAIAGRPGGPS